MLALREFTESELLAAARCIKQKACTDMPPEDVQAIFSTAIVLLHRHMFHAGPPDYQKEALEQKELAELIDSSGVAPATVDRLTELALKNRNELESALG
ncbi:MAG: hypothetical protein NT031_06790 [Planctomycetota bacterium]|nr:hypothetical protein [Planctomycetota bacterium]